MLKKVRFKNYKSFSKETIIDLEPTKSNILESTNTYDNILKGCCFYGGNASGKTNALNAITLLLDLFFKDYNINPSTAISLYTKENTMYFEYTFEQNNKTIVYYFEINREGNICKEYLTLDGKIMLNRLTNSAESYLTENRDYNLQSVDEKTLFLKKIYFNTQFTGYPEIKACFDFLKNSIYYNPIRELGKVVYFDPSKIKEIDLINYLNQNGTKEINEFLDEFNFKYRIKYDPNNNPFQSVLTTIQFERTDLPNVPLFMESYGNQVLLSILPSFLTIVKKGGILAIDEFSSGLHNKLESLLIKYFFKHSTNAQIFFVSHSTNLLKTSLLRPDQIYSVDFDKTSKLKRFSDEKPRESQNLEKMYLSGIFGGIPLYETDSE